MGLHPNGDRYYLPESKRHYPMSFFQLVTMLRVMTWGVSWCIESVHVGVLTLGAFTRSGPLRSVIDLHPGHVSREVPMEENPAQVSTFLNRFVKVRGNYLAADFRTPGWVCSSKQAWWISLTMYVLEVFNTNLK